jgi:DNA-binding MarR family transcriptional regulator
MKLEAAIQQTKPFKSELSKLQVNLIYTFHWLVAHEQLHLKDADITMQQYNILRILRGQHPNPSTILLLKERMLDKECDASRLVDRLVQKQFVSRKECSNDRRKADVLISSKGLDLLKKMDKRENYLTSLGTLTDKEAKHINDLLDKLRGDE